MNRRISRSLSQGAVLSAIRPASLDRPCCGARCWARMKVLEIALSFQRLERAMPRAAG
jgi:hypothetical protein